MSKYRKQYGEVNLNRSYMKAIRDLLQLNQYDIVRLTKEERLFRESQVSAIDAKIGYNELWNEYADLYGKLILESKHEEDIKVIMTTLLCKWIRA